MRRQRRQMLFVFVRRIRWIRAVVVDRMWLVAVDLVELRLCHQPAQRRMELWENLGLIPTVSLERRMLRSQMLNSNNRKIWRKGCKVGTISVQQAVSIM